MTAKHSPLPWTLNESNGITAKYLIIASDNRVIGSVWKHFNRNDKAAEGMRDDIDAALIVIAVNSHDELIEALQNSYNLLADISHQWRGRNTPEGQALLVSMRDTLANATGLTRKFFFCAPVALLGLAAMRLSMGNQRIGEEMSDTPRTDALCTDPAIERRDVPARVWRAMAAMERENGRLRMIVERYLATNGISLPVIDKDARALLAELAGKENLK